MTKQQELRDDSESPDFAFEPIIVRSREDGWTVDKQVDFIQALAECGCVSEACARVGMSTRSAYALRTRLDGRSFRHAWQAALDHAVERLSDAAFSRALNGVSRPVFFQGDQIGERRHYDERLTMFLLRYRDPVRYGKYNDMMAFEHGHPDAAVLVLSRLLLRVLKDGHAFDAGDPPPEHAPYDPRDSFIDNLEALAERLDAKLEAERSGQGSRSGESEEGQVSEAQVYGPQVYEPQVYGG